MDLLTTGRLTARFAQDRQDLDAVLALRAQSFRHGQADGDRFDPRCRHLMVTDGQGRVLATARVQVLQGATLDQSYTAGFYDLGPLAAWTGPMLELGRFCLASALPDPDVPRLAWALLTQLVDRLGVTMLFGCSSFPGTDPLRWQGALSLLADHVAPQDWRPGAIGPRVPFPEGKAVDRRAATHDLPPLLRTYLAMGGRVSDHAVADPDLGTLHVFTGMPVATIPLARARALRALARQTASG